MYYRTSWGWAVLSSEPAWLVIMLVYLMYIQSFISSQITVYLDVPAWKLLFWLGGVGDRGIEKFFPSHIQMGGAKVRWRGEYGLWFASNAWFTEFQNYPKWTSNVYNMTGNYLFDPFLLKCSNIFTYLVKKRDTNKIFSLWSVLLL